MIWETVVATVSAMLGAGFASGREIQVFFSAHGQAAVVLGLAATGLLSWAAARTAEIGEDRDQLSLRLFARRASWARLALIGANWLTLAAVLAVLGSLGRSATGIPANVWSLLAAAAAGAISAAGGTRQRVIQGLLLLLVVAAALPVIGLSTVRGYAALHPAVPTASAALGVFGFCAYNVALAADGIAAVRGRSRARRLGALTGGLIVGLLLTLEAIALALAPARVHLAELPLVALAEDVHGALGTFLGLATVVAGVSAAASFTAAVSQAVKSPWLAALSGYLGSLLGVGALIDQGYPIMAALAAIWLFRLLSARLPRRPE